MSKQTMAFISAIECFKSELIKIKFVMRNKNESCINATMVLLDAITHYLKEPDKPQLKAIRGGLE